MWFKNVIVLLSFFLLTPFQKLFALEQVVNAELISSVKTVAPGEMFYFAIKLDVKDPWHVYWKYPGESGLPTRINYDVAKELEVFPFKWPTPIRFTQPGGDAGFGYQTEVVFLSEAIATEGLIPGTKIPVKVKVNWLGCSPNICLPGSAELSQVIEIASITTPNKKEDFLNWLHKVPEPIDEYKGVVSYEITRKNSTQDSAEVVILINWRDETKLTDWILAVSDEYEIEPYEIINSTNNSKIDFKIKKRQGMKITEPVLDSVVKFVDSKGHEKALTIPISTGL